ncbi:sulfotransferase family protein [Gemmatimonadota bacterium]
MHRSGTSCLTGSLEQAGLYLGDVNRRARHNAKGNQENRAIMDLNDAVLAANGAAWDRPPKAPPIWSKAHRDRRDRVLASYPADQTIGFKDPRTLFTLEGWLEALPKPHLVGTFRHPLAVAQSLRARNNFSVQQALNLWLAYNRRLLEVGEFQEMPLINFDWPPDQYETAVRAICEKLDLTPPTDGFDFFEPGLLHHKPSQEHSQGHDTREVYDALLSLSVKSL